MTMRIALNHTPFGKAYLHLWRDGLFYRTARGPLFESEWTSLRFTILPYPSSQPDHPRDLRRGLPFADASFDAAYARRILEHLSFDETARFLPELLRVLKPGGICRIVVPDLEDVVRHYLSSLEALRAAPDDRTRQRHHWAVLELSDQMTRLTSGGEIARALAAGDHDPQHLRDRFGDALADLTEPDTQASLQQAAIAARRLSRRAAAGLAYGVVRRLRRWLAHDDPRYTREANVSMYDRLSLALMTEAAGFEVLGQTTMEASAIEGWSRYDFDHSHRGPYPHEPSLYFECRRPAPAKRTPLGDG